MSVSYEEAVCHLGTSGWTCSWTETDFGECDAAEVPPDRVKTVLITQTIKYYGRKMETKMTDVFLTDDKDALKQLTDKFGESPK